MISHANILDVLGYLQILTDKSVAENLSCRDSRTSKNSRSCKQLKCNRQSLALFPKIQKKERACYEISNNKISILPRSTHTFSLIFESLNHKLLARALIQNQMGPQEQPGVTLILAHNFRQSQYVDLVYECGRIFISQGLFFQVRASGSVRDSYAFSESSDRSQQVKFISQLKDAIVSFKNLYSAIEAVWIICPVFQVAIVNISDKGEACSKIIGLMAFYDNLARMGAIKAGREPNCKIAVCSLCDSIKQSNLSHCTKVVEEAVQIRQSLVQFTVKQKKQLFSFRRKSQPSISEADGETFELIQCCPRIQRTYSNYFEPKQQTRKNSYNKKQVEVEEKENLQFQQTKASKNKTKKKSNIYLSSEESNIEQDSCQQLSSVKNAAKDKASIMAENIHLKWQMQILQKQYEEQSQSYINKMNKKVKDLKQERSLCLQENGKLRKDNEQLLQEVSAIKQQYESILATRSNYETSLREASAQTKAEMEREFKIRIQEMELQVIKSAKEKQVLEKQLRNAQAILQDNRLRNRERVHELLEENENCKALCQQIRELNQNIQRQNRLQKNRCLNLEQRCKKYQESLADLWRLKSSSVSSQSNCLSNAELQPACLQLNLHDVQQEQSKKKVRQSKKPESDQQGSTRRKKMNQ